MAEKEHEALFAEVNALFHKILENVYMKDISQADAHELNNALANAVICTLAGNRRASQLPSAGKKRAYYLSAEFLVGRAIYNNLLSLGMLTHFKETLERAGVDIGIFRNIEDAALGNGGLGRLAACFLDSAATLSLPLVGYGIRYRYGIFEQRIEGGFQRELPQDWTRWGDAWSIERTDETQRVRFDDFEVIAVPYDMPVFGYENDYATVIRLWEARPVTPFDFKLFNEQDYDRALCVKNEVENISRVLYPADDTDLGKRLRLRQEYFFASASIRDVIRGYKSIHGNDFSFFESENAFQLNDTHPVIALPEFLRIMCDEEKLELERAFELARKCFSYTNHTVMSEALESWDIGLFGSILMRVYRYVELIDERLRIELEQKHVPADLYEGMRIIKDGRVHMARLALYMCEHVNGVAEVHTEILKSSVFSSWQKLYPNKLVNITNGITQRRWLAVADPQLAAFTTKLLGTDRWMRELELISGLGRYAEDSAAQNEFIDVKRQRREALARYVLERDGKRIDPDSIFDVQIKRIHEYKRQLLNALAVLEMYYEILDGELKLDAPVTVLLAGKAAPGYRMAKAVIKLICELERLISSDERVAKQLNIRFLEGYSVSYAELLVSAADISEQISTAGTEASGTGNMKMMLNGALTLGTLDGANIEIVERAGKENNFIFGATVEEVKRVRQNYRPRELYEVDIRLKRILDSLKSDMLDDGGTGYFSELYDSLVLGNDADRYLVLYDLNDYLATRCRALNELADRKKSAKKGILNMAGAGMFSSDRAIGEYSEKIWNII